MGGLSGVGLPEEALWEVSLNLDTPLGQTSLHCTSVNEKLTNVRTAILL